MRAQSILIWAGLVVAVLSLAACGTTVEYLPTNSPPTALYARTPESVDVYTAGAPDVTFYEIGILQARQSSDLSADQMPEIITEMRRVAGENGCDAIIITDRSDEIVPSSTDGGGSTTLEGYRAACIVYAPQDTEAVDELE